MKQKKTVVLLAALLSCVFCFADDYYYDDVYFFNGVSGEYQFRGKKYKVEKQSLETQVQQMNSVYTNGKQKVLMGHSAGGLKAMAYASLLSQNGKSKEVKGVITMGAPLKGFTALAQGRDNLNQQLNRKISTLEGAAEPLVEVADSLVATATSLVPILPIPPGFVSSTFTATKSSIKEVLSRSLGYNIFRYPLNSMIDLGLMGDSFVRDISPNSNFMNNYINPRTTVKTPAYTQTVKQYAGWGYYEAVWKTKRNCFGWKYSYISGWKWVKVYNYKQIHIAATYNYYPRIDKNIPVGMIVGQGSDPLEALGNDEDAVRKLMDVVSGSLVAAQAIQISKAVFYYSLIFTARKGVKYTKSAIKCSDARNLLKNYEKEYGKLLGSRDNDSFITEDSQQYSLDKLGGKIIDKKRNTSVFFSSSTHFKETSHDEIWGDGHEEHDSTSSNEAKQLRLKGGSIQKDGILWDCFNVQDWAVYDSDGKILNEDAINE